MGKKIDKIKPEDINNIRVGCGYGHNVYFASGPSEFEKVILLEC